MSSASAHGWTRSSCPAEAKPIEQRLHLGRVAERDLRAAARRLALRDAHPAVVRTGLPRRRHRARVAHHRGAGRHRRAAHGSGRAVHRPLGAGSHLLPDGFRRRLVADGAHRRLAGPVRHRLRGAQGSRVPTGRRHRAAVEGRLAGQGPARPRSPRRLPRTSGRPLDRVPGAHQRPRAARLRRGGGVAARTPPDRLHPGTHARRLPVRQRDVPQRCAGAARGDRRLGDGNRRRPEARPRLDGAGLARGHQRARRRGIELRRHAEACRRATR